MVEERFGRIVLQTDMGEVFSLDLHEGENLIYRGFYLPPPHRLAPLVEIPIPEGEEPPSLLHEIELAAAPLVRDLVEGSVEEVDRGDGLRVFLFSDPEVSDYRLWVEMTSVPAAGERRAESWTGRVLGYGGEFNFVLERFGTPEAPALLVMLFILIFFEPRASEALDECYRKVVEACGERRIKRYRGGRTLTLLNPLGFNYNCEWECM